MKFSLKSDPVLTIFFGIILFTTFAVIPADAQHSWNTSTEKEERPLFTKHFSQAEFSERRNKVYDQIGNDSFAILQGAPMPMGFQFFRQNNEFYYLSGIESPYAYLILDGPDRVATVYLQDRNERREYGEGKVLSYQDADLVKDLSGIDAVKHIDDLKPDIEALNEDRGYSNVFTHLSPYENLGVTRSIANRTLNDRQNDPFDERPGRHQEFIEHLEKLTTTLEMQNLDPITDEMRKIKSAAEIELITKSSDLQGHAIMESIRSTKPGIKAYEMEAIARYIYWKNGVEGEGYYALTHIGPDAYMNHYHGSERSARDGDMILMDYGPVYDYYTSDMARMWPANGTFNPVQRELYSFYLEFYEAILYNIEIGRTPEEIMRKTLNEFENVFADMEFSKEIYRQAAEEFIVSYQQRLNPNMGLGHGVGLAVHDVGDYSTPIEPGMVFVIEPQFRVPEENIYLRLEDMIVVTEDGVEVITDFVPRDIDGIEALMAEEGMLQRFDFTLE
ncbi:aminopeptidase P family protein [Rhodohalobacter sp. SW132]|uniref:M24 family metallopeptidase n=1 Tax=Rhodohalobacter sp. SW132 TaxID=2293433 RepID=UPI000E27A1EB|nr:Xaa-Pro peptidase family protein [Rhodohalobacter sp. SW132]REL29216.1 aminopeptidase P family protein [Rhodohalobacter sp. SW132]